MTDRSTILLSALFIALLGAAGFSEPVPSDDTAEVAGLIRDIQAGPSVWYTPDAYNYFLSRGSLPPRGAATDKESAARCFAAIDKVSRLPIADASRALPAIAALFPKLIHMVYVRNAVYGGNEGTFDDCLDTYIADAKSQFIVSPPILDYNFMSRYENFIEESHEIEFISKQQNAGGQIVAAAFNLKIFITVYIGEAALARLTGQTLGHDRNAWMQLTGGGTPAVPAPMSTPSPAPANTTTPVAPAPAAPTPSLPVQPGRFSTGTSYRLFLTTDNELVGTVVSQDAASVTITTAAGKSYVIPFGLIKSSEALNPSASPGTP
jgi:hypothetical protein